LALHSPPDRPVSPVLPPSNAAVTASPEIAQGSGTRLRAIGLMVLAVTVFSALDTAAKYLVKYEHVSVAQVVWSRFIVQFLAILVLVPLVGGLTVPQLFQTSQLRWQLVRSVLMVATTLFNFLALQYLRLDQTITIVFLAPLVVALLAGPLLGEWVGWRRMVAIAVGFCGILIAVRPGFGAVHPAVVYSFLAMLAYALFMLLTRHIARYDPPMVTLFYSMFAGTILGAPFAYMQWIPPPDALSFVLLVSLGVLGGLGHWMFIHAYRMAPASAVAPFLYLQLISMVSFGYAVFGDLPDVWTLAGAAVVVGSGVYLFHRERVTAKSEAALLQPQG
jgi:drug/metabolite transporter (DMT)-like permease